MGVPRCKAGELKAGYGKLSGYDLDLVGVSGEGVGRADRALLVYSLMPLLKELVERGYSPDSLKFSIKKLPSEGKP